MRHSGRNFADGRNAIVNAAHIALALDDLNGIRDHVTINVGRLRGGDAVNVVPDTAVLRVNVRVTSSEDQHWIESQVKSIVDRYQRTDEGFGVELHGGILAAPKVADQETQLWMARVEQVGAELGQQIRWKSSGGASDGNKLASLGLPNIDTFGPEGDLLHSPEEWIYLPSLPKKAILTYGMLRDLAHQQ